MKHYFCDKEVIIDKDRNVYRDGQCIGKSIQCSGYKHYLVGACNKGPIITK